MAGSRVWAIFLSPTSEIGHRKALTQWIGAVYNHRGTFTTEYGYGTHAGLAALSTMKASTPNMTNQNEAIVPPSASIVPPVVGDGTEAEVVTIPNVAPEAMTPAQRLAALRQKRDEDIRKATEAVDKRIEREAAKIQADVEEEAMASKRVALSTELQGFIADTLNNLAIEVPETGLKLNPMITIERDSAGKSMISITWPEKKASARSATSGGGTRAARGTGVDNRPATTKIEGLTSFKLPNGTTTKRPGDVLDAMGISHAGDSAPRKLAAYARSDEGYEKANEIIAIVGDVEHFLGELVRDTWPVDEADDEATADAEAEAATATA